MSDLLVAPSPGGAHALSVCTFKAGEALYGIDVLLLREVSRTPRITPLPQAPVSVRGLANLRSSIFLVLDLRPMVGLEPREPDTDSRLIVLKPAVAENLAVLVDCGGDVRTVPRERLEYRSELLQQSAGGEPPPTHDLVVGTAKLDDELLLLIDPRRFEETIERLIR